MRVPLNWVRQYVTFDASVEDIAERLNMAGIEVEGIEPFEGRGGDPDTVFVTYVTPNRGDWLSIVGNAREIAASLDTSYKIIEPKGPSEDRPPETRFTVDIEAPDLCPRYVGLLATGVQVGPSPDWLVDRIEAAGVRAINNVVDVTNFVALELGQPLHAFDLTRLKGPKIIVRRALPGEKLLTIDGRERELDRRDLVIADAEDAIALAGVMGGLPSEVSAGTSDVLIESAHFSPVSIRRSARRHGMSSEASFRFERFVDPEGALRAAWRAAELMVKLCGAEVACGAIDAYPKPHGPQEITLRPKRVNQLLGTDLSTKQMADCLRRLDLPVETGDDITVTAPSFRPDLQKEVDLIEEVARVYGYNTIGTALPKSETVAGRRQRPQLTADAVRATLVGSGLCEAWTYSLVPAEETCLLELPEDDPRRRRLTVANPLSLDASSLRTMLTPCMLRVAQHNVRHGNRDLALFEVGRVYRALDGEDRADERLTVSILMTGSNMRGAWNRPDEVTRVDFYSLKAVVESLMAERAGEAYEIGRAEETCFERGACAAVVFDGKEIGRFGLLSPKVAANYDLAQDVLLAEIDIEGFVDRPRPTARYVPVPRFPDVQRDLALVVDRTVTAGQVEVAIRAAGGEHLVEVSVFDLYEGDQIEAGKKSLAFSLCFRSTEGTLTDEQVTSAIESICDHAGKELGATLRQ